MGALFDFPTSPGRTVGPGTAHANKLLVGRLVAALNRQDWPALSELLAPGFVRHGRTDADGDPSGADSVLGLLRGVFAGFPDATLSVEDMLAEGDRVAVRHQLRGSRRGFDLSALAIYRIDGERIAEVWAEWGGKLPRP